ncbi:MAG: (2Fe-2S)-binding protein [Granulosicoccaceae bacterium]
MATSFTLNGAQHSVDVSPDTPLLWVLRDHLGYTGTKYGCGIAQCGACTVHLDGAAIRSCSMPIAAVEGKAVTTIEGVAADTIGATVAKSWEELAVVQCGYCQSGQIMSATALLRDNPTPDDNAIDAAMRGNICRCATYQRVRAAIKHAANELA